jgi:hypothetical protein
LGEALRWERWIKRETPERWAIRARRRAPETWTSSKEKFLWERRA